MKRTLIQNASIVNEGITFRGSVVIEGEVIKEILPEGEIPTLRCDEVIDARSYYLLPGIIDDHVHFREPGLTNKADIWSETHAAVAGGVTSYMDMPNVIPQTITLEGLEEKYKLAAGKSLVNYSFYFGATNNNIDTIRQLDKQKVCGIKLFMGSSTGNMLVNREDALRKLFSEAEILIAAHCEDQDIVSKNTAEFKTEYGDDPDIKYHPIIRSGQACFSSSALAVKLAKETGARLHILHLTTARELELLDNLPLKKKRITAEVCIPHLVFSDEDYARLGARIKCNPAIKSITDRDALREALKNDLLDVIATDHAPHLLPDKEGGALKAVSGMPMIQFSLVSMLQLVKQHVLTLEQVVRKMCHAPAELFEISRRGFIREGYQADLVLVDMNTSWKLTSADVLSKCGWSPLEGAIFSSKVITTFVNGQVVYNHGTVNENVRGQALRFRES